MKNPTRSHRCDASLGTSYDTISMSMSSAIFEIESVENDTLSVPRSPRPVSSSVPPHLRRKYKYSTSARSIFTLISFTAVIYFSTPAALRSQNEIEIEFNQTKSALGFRRILGEQVVDQDHNHRITKQFCLRSGFFPETHPSRPYYVTIDEETGAFVDTVEYGLDVHPLSRLADVREPRDANPESVFFFIMPKASAGKVKAIMTQCFNLRRSEKVEEPESPKYIGGVLNIDTQTLKGLARARSNHIIDSGLVDVFATSYFFEGMLLFKTEHRGRAFTILEHPVHRAESLHHSRRNVSGIDLDLLDYLESPFYHDNWVVRSLTNNRKGQVTEDHLLVAKGILAQKFFVGIADHFEETIKRLELYYGWDESDNKGCVDSHFEKNELERVPQRIERGSYEWNLIVAKDNLDVMLYYYALELFTKQGSTMFHRPYVDKEGAPIDFAELKRKQKLKDQLMNLIFIGD